MAYNPYITVEDVRHYILDRDPSDNEFHRDLQFSEDEIHVAMERAAREYNSIPPPIGGFRGDCLPKSTNMMFDAIVDALYTAEAGRLARNEVDYDAGGVRTDLTGKQIEWLRQLAAEARGRFVEAASHYKIQRNLAQAFGPLG